MEGSGTRLPVLYFTSAGDIHFPQSNTKHRMTLGQVPSSEGVSVARFCFLFILVPNVKQSFWQ